MSEIFAVLPDNVETDRSIKKQTEVLRKKKVQLDKMVDFNLKLKLFLTMFSYCILRLSLKYPDCLQTFHII